MSHGSVAEGGATQVLQVLLTCKKPGPVEILD
jgi:hypothetical protein